MNYNQLYNNILSKKSFLCTGLDSDPLLMPEMFKGMENPIYNFNKAIIKQTVPYTVAYKLNVAFYEAYGAQGWHEFEMTVKFIKENYPDVIVIADAKRGDIGNTAKMYAKAFFENLPCDAVTLAPYMGSDSIKPFLEYKDKWAVVLALTSNGSASDYELLNVDSSEGICHNTLAAGENTASALPLYETVIRKTMSLGSKDNIMFVVGATRPEKLREIRSLCPDNFFLVPGVGAQGGTIEEVAKNGMNDKCGILINASRSIIYSDHSANFACAAALKAKEMAMQMSKYL